MTSTLPAFVDAIIAGAGAGIAPPFPLPAWLTPNTFFAALVLHLRVAGAPPTLHGICLPGTSAQFALVMANVMELCSHPYMAAVAAAAFPVLPLFRLYTPRANGVDAIQKVFVAPAVPLF